MAKSLIILHSSPESTDNRAFTAMRLAGALLTDDKEVVLFLVEDGAKLADPKLGENNACRGLFYEMMDTGMQVLLCGATMRKMGWDEGRLVPGITKSSMNALSALMTEADDIITL